MQLSSSDLALLAVLAIPVPLFAAHGYRTLLRRIASGDETARLRVYRQTIVLEWSSVILLLALWLAAGRTLETLGFSADGSWRFWLGNGLALAASLLLFHQAANLTRTPEALARVREKIAHVESMVPHTQVELNTFRVLSVTAGICEEIVYRGYSIWALTALSGVWPALLGSAVLFSLAHLYQGSRSIPGILLVGLVMGGLYLLTGALWAPMVLHTAIDLVSGRSAYEALSATGGDDGLPA